MKPYYQDEAVTIYHGDCRKVLPTLAPESVDMIWTDPPYGHNNADGDLLSRVNLGNVGRPAVAAGFASGSFWPTFASAKLFRHVPARWPANIWP